MGDAVRNAVMNRSSNMGSARKDNAEGVARRRAAIQQEIEERQKLARKLQDEKMARAVAQKEGRLLKQREAQQREMLRAKAVLDRRTQILAEKEREKKEAVLGKVHALASRLTTPNKSRPLYAFGSSTPRELEYLTQLTREQKIYDRKLMHFGRISTAPSGSSSRSTLSPPYDLHHNTSSSMTGSLYIAQSELKTSHKRTPNFMTQSMMIAHKPNKTTKIHQTPVHRQSMAQRPQTATKPASSLVTEVPIRTKKPMQQNSPPFYKHESETIQFKFEAKTEALKTEPLSGKIRKSTGLEANSETKAEVMLEKSPGDKMNENETKVVEKPLDDQMNENETKVVEKPLDDQMNENETKVEVMLEKSSGDQMGGTFVIPEQCGVVVQGDVTSMGAGNIIYTKEIVNSVPDINGLKKIDKKSIVMEVSDAEERLETADHASKVIGSDIQDGNADIRSKITLENESACIAEVTAVEEISLFNISLEQEDNNATNQAKVNTAAMVTAVADNETKINEKQKKENDILEEARLGEVVRGDSVAVCPDLSQAESVIGGGGNVETGAEVFVQEESLIADGSFHETGRHHKQEEIAIEKTYETTENRNENDIPTIETNGNLLREKTDLSALNKTLNAVGIETVAEHLKLTEEKNPIEEKRRIQDELLKKEQREREMRKAKLASIMSRTRNNAPSVSIISGAPTVSVVSSTLHLENSETETLKHRVGIPLSNEYMPMKNVLSNTTASVLQKLATTNPKLLSVLQRNGSNRSLADELSAADPSMSMTLQGQPADSIAGHEGSSTARHLHFEPDVNHRPVAMK